MDPKASGHDQQEDNPVTLANVATGHAVHVDWPADDEKFPIGQGRHTIELIPEYKPVSYFYKKTILFTFMLVIRTCYIVYVNLHNQITQ